MLFSSCGNLASVTIGSNVTRIGDGVFYDCTSLNAVNVDGNNPAYYSDESGVLYNKEKTALLQYPAGNARTSFTVPDSVTSIGDHAFHACANLAAVTIGNGVAHIGGWAFYDCASLSAVTIPDAVTQIDLFSFCGCTSLANVQYRGSEQDRQKITIGGRNDSLSKAAWEYTDPHARIIHGNPADGRMEYAYRTTVTFTVEMPEGGKVQWYVDGQPAGSDVTLTVRNAKKSYTVTVVVTSSNGTPTTDEEQVSIKTDFWSKIVWFFTHLLLPARFRIEQ